MEGGKRRIDLVTDYVRIEIASALKREIPVIPVLVEGGRMPDPESVPEELRDLALKTGMSRGSAPIVKFAAQETWWLYSPELFPNALFLQTAVASLVK